MNCFLPTGNLVVILVTIKDKGAKLPTNLIIGALALSDCFIGAISVPFAVFVKLAYSDYGWMPCAISPFFLSAPILCSMLCMVLIALERYGAIVKNKTYTVKQIKVAIAIICMFSFIVGFVLYPSKFLTDPICVPTNFTFSHLLTLSIIIALLTIFMIVVYIRINNQLTNMPNMSSTRQKQKQQATRSFLMCYLWYVICFTPAQVLGLVQTGLRDYGGIENKLSFKDTYAISILLALLNSVMNPILYAIFNVRMRYVIYTIIIIIIFISV